MAIQTTSTFSYGVISQYRNRYDDSIKKQRLYDQLAIDYDQYGGGGGLTMEQMMQSDTIYIPFLSGMTPGVTAVNQTYDVTPQTLTDARGSMTWTSRGEALQWAKQVDIQVYTDYAAKAYEKLGENAADSIELLAEAAACQGTFVKRAAARADLNAGTSTHRLTDAEFAEMDAQMQELKVPGYFDGNGTQIWSAIMHPYLFHDLRESGNVDTIGTNQDSSIHLNWQLGQIGSFRLLSSPYAKVFGAAGADFATATATTVGTASTPLATTLVTAADVSAYAADGEWWTVGTEETANTFYPTNERFKVLSASTYTLTILGQAENGGLKYAHAAGEAVRNADSAYTVVLGGPQSLVRVYATDVGPYGQIIPPEKKGTLKQWTTIGWLWYGQYARIAENRILRGEFSTSFEA